MRCGVVAAVLCHACLSAAAGDLEQFHLAPGDTPSEMVVSFVTVGATEAGALPSCALSGGATFQGTTSTYADGGWQGQLYEVKLTGLVAGKRYSYTCSVGGSARASAPQSFAATPARATLPVALAVVADLGAACPTAGCGNATITALAGEVQQRGVQAVVHAGDIAYADGTSAIWDDFMREMQPAVAGAPYLVAVGNHEHHYNFSAYRHRFSMPGEAARASQSLWWSTDVGGVHLLSFSTEHALEPQLPFIEADLAAAVRQREEVPWILVMGHKPMYCSTNDYYDCNMGPKKWTPMLEPLLKKYGVDLAFFGHLHNYERSWPMFQGKVEVQGYANATDTVHLVLGGAGDDEGLTDRWMEPTPAWSAKRDGTSVGYSRMFFDTASSMRFEYVESSTGHILDNFTLTKQRAPRAALSAIVV